MKLTKLLAFAAVGVAAGLLLTRTEKGNQIRKDIADAANNLGKKLDKLRNQSSQELAEEVTNVARKARQKVDGQLS